MIKVLFDHQAFTMQTHGGVSRCFAELYKHLPADISAKIGLRESNNAYIDVFEDVKPVGYDYEHFICRKPFRGKGHLYLWAEKFRKVKRYPNYNQNNSIKLLKDGNFDVFHPTYFSNYFLPYLNGKPFVLTIHDMIPELYPQYFRRDDFQIQMKRKLAPLASAIVAVSETTKKDVIRILGVPEEKVFVIHHGCSFPEVKDASKQYQYPYILYVGARWSYKNFTPFVRSVIPLLEKYKDLHVVCTGSPFNDKEKAFLDGQEVGKRFVQRWVKDDTELYSLYHHAVCFVYPSDYEGFGIPILEAYRADCPVVLNRASCFPEIAGDAAVYFNMDSDSSDMAERINDLMQWPDHRKEELLSAQRKRLTLYSWGKAAEQLANVYRMVI